MKKDAQRKSELMLLEQKIVRKTLSEKGLSPKAGSPNFKTAMSATYNPNQL